MRAGRTSLYLTQHAQSHEALCLKVSLILVHVQSLKDVAQRQLRQVRLHATGLFRAPKSMPDEILSRKDRSLDL